MNIDNKTPLIYWIGGSTCAGKTTISNILSTKYGFTVYHCDEYLGKHIEKSNSLEHPNLNRLTKVSWNDILSLKVEDYLNWTIDLFHEEFEMILEDLNTISNDKPILVEGVNLLPELIKDQLFDYGHTIWVVADEEFYKCHQMQRKELFDRINECSNPELALDNYMSYDLAFGKYIFNEAKRLDFKVITVNNENDIKDNVDLVTSYFNLMKCTANNE
ncbi:MAG: hypothetical protein K0S41_1417 [Anaerocolumna sp.]|jgi:2-phosphoglycerate kinase|nr:hypothetical protein [Anaerocolumna sp.]